MSRYRPGRGCLRTPDCASLLLPRCAGEVRATLAAGGCPLPLAARAEQAYRAASRQAGFDGPLIVELSMLRMLVSIYKARYGA